MLTEITSHLADYTSPAKANQFHQDLTAYVRKVIATFPAGCPPCRFAKLKNAECRCCPYKKQYIIVHQREGSAVKIIGVVSAKRHSDAFDDLV